MVALPDRLSTLLGRPPVQRVPQKNLTHATGFYPPAFALSLPHTIIGLSTLGLP